MRAPSKEVDRVIDSESSARFGRCGDGVLKDEDDACMRPSFGLPAGAGNGRMTEACIPGRIVLSCSSSEMFSNAAATACVPPAPLLPVIKDSFGALLDPDPAVVAEDAAAPSSLLEDGVCAPELLLLPLLPEAFKGISRRGPGLRGREGAGIKADIVRL